MIENRVPDSLWERVQPLLPERPPRRRLYPGRKPCDDRAVLAGMMFVLETGIGWNQRPRQLFGCSGTTCWRRLHAWTDAGVWPRLHELLLAELRTAGQLDLDRCVINASHVRAWACHANRVSRG